MYTNDVRDFGNFTIRVQIDITNLTYLNSTYFTWNLNVTTNMDWCSYYLLWSSVPTIGVKQYWAGDPADNFTFADVTWSSYSGCTRNI